MVYAQILSGIVVNTIVLGDRALVPIFIVGFDYCVEIDTLTPQPSIGWSYDGAEFTAPTD